MAWQAEVGLKSPVSVVQEYDRKKKLAGDLGNGFVRFKLSPSKVGHGMVWYGMVVLGAVQIRLWSET